MYDALGYISHVGANMRYGPGYVHYENVPDETMAWLYSSSKLSVGLRRIEGFELPIIEGAACGAVPVAFDLECYRHWFNDIAIFIDHEGDVERQLSNIRLDGDYSPDLSAFEQDNAWKPFWEEFRREFK